MRRTAAVLFCFFAATFVCTAIDKAREEAFIGKRRNWWSFQKPVRSAPPAIEDSWVRNPIDAFILQALRDKNPEGWDFYVQQFQDSLKPALAAIDAKNSQALFDAGEKIDETCENCHTTFWYPKAVKSTSTR